MGNKVIRLTEADIKKMVDKVLSEQRYEQRGKVTKSSESRFNLGNLFDSGEYKLQQTNDLNNTVKSIGDFISKYGEDGVLLKITAGESNVPNPKGFEEKGSLAKARAEEVKKYINRKFPNVMFGETTIVPPKVKWEPSKGKDHADYKKEQFVDLSVQMKNPAFAPKVLIVPKPMYGQDASGIKTFVGFVDGSVFVFDKNNETQRGLLSQFSRIPEFDNFRKSRLKLTQVCNKNNSMCDTVKYDRKNYVTVDSEDVFNQLVDKVKKERLKFPENNQGQELA